MKPHPDWALVTEPSVLRFAVFSNEKFDLWLCFACWLFATLLSKVFWREFLVEGSLSCVHVIYPVNIVQLLNPGTSMSQVTEFSSWTGRKKLPTFVVSPKEIESR